MRTVSFADGFKGWRNAARVLLAYKIAPHDIEWQEDGKSSALLWDDHKIDWQTMGASAPKLGLNVSRRFLDMAEAVSFHRNPEKWQLLYSLIWRLTYENPKLLDLSIDEQVQSFLSMEHSVRRDAHKAKAFVRFRKIEQAEGDLYCAWHEPEHPLLAYVAPFFQDRFSVMKWTILTPDQSVHWDGSVLKWGPGCSQEEGPKGDTLEDLWGCYYKSIFNPARVKLKAMRSEMPKKYWHSMPETQLIEELIFESDARVDAMIRATPASAADFIPLVKDLETLRAALPSCSACDLCAKATQGVFGMGNPRAKLMLVGEQPGEREDEIGLPFQGPAGQLLQSVLDKASLGRDEIYMTNAVKAFKHRREGKRRIHEKPTPREVGTCKAWLQAELASVKPTVVLCLGLTAALAVLGQSVRLMDVRDKVLDVGNGLKVIVTHHPAHILRIQDGEEKAAALLELESALQLARDLSLA
ncbi:MAG: UdgX family uracil-DNA binding protein [Chitinophagaceae bacterium]|nr:UdgX family uracil-DNA binding protein [Oligoflexus sp.]